MPKVLFIFGTRPEAIKLSPVVLFLRQSLPHWSTRVCVTAQHRGLLDQVLDVFSLVPDHDLDLMRPGQTLAESAGRILTALDAVIGAERPDLVYVQGDTTTTFCGALAAFYRGVPVGHIEAGLRTGDKKEPFPEEINRVLTTRVTDLHFAATPWAAANLQAEGVTRSSIVVTGNPGIDAVLWVSRRLEAGELLPAAPAAWLTGAARKKRILVTAHRRESFGEGFTRICEAIRRLARRGDVELIYPVHPNPNVREPVQRLLAGLPDLHLIDPLDYVSFVDHMRSADLLLTDSGGVQEEGPSLGKPVLVMRDKTERPEAVEAGTARLVGTDSRRIAAEAERLLDDPESYQAMARVHNPYGDGRASDRIAEASRLFLGV